MKKKHPRNRPNQKVKRKSAGTNKNREPAFLVYRLIDRLLRGK